MGEEMDCHREEKHDRQSESVTKHSIDCIVRRGRVVTAHLPGKLSKGRIRASDDAGDPGGGPATVRVIDDGPIEGGLDVLGGGGDAAGVQGATGRAEGPAAHPADQEELTLGAAHAPGVAVVSGRETWWQDTQNVARQFVPKGSRSYARSHAQSSALGDGGLTTHGQADSGTQAVKAT